MAISETATPALDGRRTLEARKTLGVLACAQALSASGPPVIISLGGMVGQLLATNKHLVTLPVSLYQVGVAVSTVPVAFAISKLGRRPAYLIGAFAMMCAGLTAAFGIYFGSFLMFCIGTALAGFNGACVQSYRFAAVEVVPPSDRGRAIALVLLGGLAAAIIGPQMVIWTRDLVPGLQFAGSFMGQAALALLVIPVLTMLRSARSVAPTQARASGGRPLSTVARQPAFFTAVAVAVVSHASMSFIMTAAPLAMVLCGHTVGEAALGIQWHVLAMFGPSFFTGHLIKRFGETAVMAAGLLLIGAGAVLALTGLEVWQFWGALVLLGLGWNFGFTGATTAVTGCHRPEERAKVQGLNDLLVFGATAIASLSSGSLLEASGWTTIQVLILPIVAVPLLLLLTVRLSRRRAAAYS